MSLFSFLRKNKQQSASEDSAFYSRAEEASGAGRSRGKSRSTGRQGRQATLDEAPADPVLPEKKRARRRLVGAVALVLAAVVGLPMILDSEPKPLADDITIEIPSRDKAPPPAVRPVSPRASSTVSAAAALAPTEEMIEVPAVDAGSAIQKDRHETPPVAAAPTPKPREESRPAIAPPKHAVIEKPLRTSHTENKARADVKIDTKAAARAEDAARALALLQGKPDPEDAEQKSVKFVIQVAALATKEKVDELQARLKKAGIKSYTQKVATVSGDRTRIRVGPFASKEEAEKMRARIVKLGLNGTLVPT